MIASGRPASINCIEQRSQQNAKKLVETERGVCADAIDRTVGVPGAKIDPCRSRKWVVSVRVGCGECERECECE